MAEFCKLGGLQKFVRRNEHLCFLKIAAISQKSYYLIDKLFRIYEK